MNESNNNNNQEHSPSFLTMEEEFALAAFDMQADKLSREQAINLLKQTYRLYIGVRRLYLNELANSFTPSSALIP
jgi:hypothetical protein